MMEDQRVTDYIGGVKHKAHGAESTQQRSQSGQLHIFGEFKGGHKFWSFNSILILLLLYLDVLFEWQHLLFRRILQWLPAL